MSEPTETPAPRDSRHILVVDDDASIRRLIIAALRREDMYTFLEAGNGREALDVLRSTAVDLVVLDLMMPIVSGWDVLQERQKETALRNIPVIVVSASRGPEIADAVDKGICAFLPKPFDITALHALVRGCLVAGGNETAIPN